MFRLGQKGDDAQEVRTEALQRVELGMGMKDLMQVVVFDAGDQGLAVGEEIWPHLELHGKEEVLAEEKLVQDDQSGVHQWTDCEEQWEKEKKGQDVGLVAQKQFLLQGESLMQ